MEHRYLRQHMSLLFEKSASESLVASNVCTSRFSYPVCIPSHVSEIVVEISEETACDSVAADESVSDEYVAKTILHRLWEQKVFSACSNVRLSKRVGDE